MFEGGGKKGGMIIFLVRIKRLIGFDNKYYESKLSTSFFFATETLKEIC